LISGDNPSSTQVLKDLDHVELFNRLKNVSEISGRRMRDVTDDTCRINISLRLWAGCIDAAKCIASETMDGQNTIMTRRESFIFIDSLADRDLIYRAGVQAAPAFKKLNNQLYFFDGVPEDSAVRSYPNEYLRE
jgi:hypothetical protein